MLDQLKDIYYSVKDNFIWTADPDTQILWNDGILEIADVWRYLEPDEHGLYRGDCEDFCLTLDKLVKEQTDIPLEKRILTYCVTETGEGHMVLEVDGHVFDNRQRGLTTLRKLKTAGYTKFAQAVDKVYGQWKYL